MIFIKKTYWRLRLFIYDRFSRYRW